MTFYSFIREQIGRNDPLGDLASDIRKDKTAPKRSSSYSRWETYLLSKGACSGAQEALRTIWGEFKKHCKAKSK